MRSKQNKIPWSESPMLISFKLIKKILSKKLNLAKLEKTRGNCIIFKTTKKPIESEKILEDENKKRLKNPQKTKRALENLLNSS